jgi:hypothetical protein
MTRFKETTIMKKMYLKGLVVAATLSIASTAFAGFWSSYVQLTNLDTAADGYIVYPSAAINNPAGCSDPSQVWGYSGSTDVEKDLMNKTLLSAFLANRKVRLNVASTVCSGTHPVYLAVRVDSAQ